FGCPEVPFDISVETCNLIADVVGGRTKMRIHAIILLGCLISTACATQVQSRVAVFHQLPTSFAQGSSFVILPWDDDQRGSLEFSTYASEIAHKLERRGLVKSAEGTRATYAVFVDYGIDNGRTETTSYSVPRWGVTGYSGSTTTGT